MKKKVTAIFDIGKTNKKFFLFDMSCIEVYREYIQLEEIEDDEGYPCEDLKALKDWCKDVFFRMLDSPVFEIIAVNFSCYGASFVHIDENGKVLTPLYNYIKPLDKEIQDVFFKKYGPEEELIKASASQKSGMLNSGLQLFWIKHTKKDVYKKIKYSLHLPQYLSYIFSGKPVSEYTSIGCHTMLWNYEKNKYHAWVYKEGFDRIFPSITASNQTTTKKYGDKSFAIGVGIHDSSAALLPYIRSIKKEFILVSTGTWSISINPFNKEPFNSEDVKNNCLFNMRVDGKPVKVSSLFLGNEYAYQKKVLTRQFNVSEAYHKSVKFDKAIFLKIKSNFQYMFKWESIKDENIPFKTKIPYEHFEYAYHQLIEELVLLQIKSIRSVKGNMEIKNLFIEGGFSDNDVFIKILSYHLPKMKLKTIDSSLGSALGAAIVISDLKLEPKFLKKNYSLKKRESIV